MGEWVTILGETFEDDEVIEVAEFLAAIMKQFPPPEDHAAIKLARAFDARAEEICSD